MQGWWRACSKSLTDWIHKANAGLAQNRGLQLFAVVLSHYELTYLSTLCFARIGDLVKNKPKRLGL